MTGFWTKTHATSDYNSWCGYAFEILCLNHLDQIIRALGIDGSVNTPCSWTYKPPKSVLSDEEADDDLKYGTQIDLLIDRSDQTINFCEMKYSSGEYEIKKDYDALLKRRQRIFKKATKTRKSIVTAFITPNGLLNNIYSRQVIRQVTGDQLFD